jgi:hypothetical protein
MKNLLLGLLFLTSLSAKSQSYFILSNGVTLTINKAGYIFDLDNFFLPYKVQVNGGQFLVSDKILHTVDENGFLYKKDLKVEEVKGKGLNYFISDDNHLVTIDSLGIFFKYDKEKSIFKKAKGFGGNFFTVLVDEKKKITDLYTINSKGNYFKIKATNLNPHSITTFGGNKWFLTDKNVLYTVSAEGMVFEKPEIKIGKISKAGGNFFIDDQNKIYTISDEGYVFLPNLPLSFKFSSLSKFGSNYMLDKDGNAFVVDSMGNIFQRNIEEHDLRNVKINSHR